MMCKFCESLTDNTKEIIWSVRSTYADDNICEFVNGDNCFNCGRCEMYFTIDGYTIDDDTYVSIAYNQKITSPTKEEVVIRPFSEGIQFNYCPICGKRISKNIREFDKYYELIIEIKDED